MFWPHAFGLAANCSGRGADTIDAMEMMMMMKKKREMKAEGGAVL